MTLIVIAVICALAVAGVIAYALGYQGKVEPIEFVPPPHSPDDTERGAYLSAAYDPIMSDLMRVYSSDDLIRALVALDTYRGKVEALEPGPWRDAHQMWLYSYQDALSLSEEGIRERERVERAKALLQPSNPIPALRPSP